jgi:hypothetical protein
MYKSKIFVLIIFSYVFSLRYLLSEQTDLTWFYTAIFYFIFYTAILDTSLSCTKK